MKKSKKKIYTSPTVKTTRIVLEGHIATIHSPIQKVDLEHWHPDEHLHDHPSNNADIWLNL